MKGFENISYSCLTERNSYPTKLMLEGNVKNEAYGRLAHALFTYKIFSLLHLLPTFSLYIFFLFSVSQTAILIIKRI